jgi:hypothetical protein
MIAYRIYAVGEGGQYTGATVIECPSDEAAIKAAQQLANGDSVELWEGHRFIARIEENEPVGRP